MPWDDFNPVGAHKSSQSDHHFQVDIMLEEEKKNDIEKKGTIGNKHRESNHMRVSWPYS